MSPSSSFIFNLTKLVDNSELLFANKTLTVCLVQREPFVMFNGIGKRDEISSYSGVAVDILRSFMEIFSFNVRVYEPADNQFGSQRLNLTWTGLMGELVAKRADIGLTALSITNSRAHAIDFTRAYYVETTSILLPIPEEVQNYYAILAPLSTSAWLLLLTTILVLITLVAFMTKLESELNIKKASAKVLSSINNYTNKSKVDQKLQAKQYKQTKKFAAFNINQFYYATNCVLAILLLRDIKEPPRESAPRILICVWWLSTIIIVNIYQGILFGLLVVPQRQASISTIDELVEQNVLSWGVTTGSALHDLFSKSTQNSVYGKVAAKMANVSDVDSGIARVLETRKFAFIRESSILAFKVAAKHKELRSCKLMFAREQFYSIGFGIGTQKQSNLTKALNAALALLIEGGFVSRSNARHFPQLDEFSNCKPQPLKEGEPLSMKHFASIFAVCALGVLLSALVLVHQLLLKHCKNTLRVEMFKFLPKLLSGCKVTPTTTATTTTA